MKRIIPFYLLFSLAFVGCGDNETSEDGSLNALAGGQRRKRQCSWRRARARPANEINAQITGSDGSTSSLAGSAETIMPESNQAVVLGGTLTVFLSASDGSLTTFDVNAPADAIPGTVSITSEGGSGTWLTIASMEGIYTSSGGSITVNQCPEAGEVITGTFDVELNDFFGGTSSLTGEWRATVETSDNSITCVVIEPEPAETETTGEESGGGTGEGTGEGTGGSGACDLEVCDGPCCPYIDPVLDCQMDCFNGACNPIDPSFLTEPEACAGASMNAMLSTWTIQRVRDLFSPSNSARLTRDAMCMTNSRTNTWNASMQIAAQNCKRHSRTPPFWVELLRFAWEPSLSVSERVLTSSAPGAFPPHFHNRPSPCI